jgi:DNA-binding MarR family transcriptional regulator
MKNIENITVFDSPKESPGYLLWRVSTYWRSAIEESLKPFNLTHPQFVVLATTAWLTRKGDLVNQIDISKATSLDPNTTSQILRGLEQKNLIKRTRSVNERNKNPQLTKIGSTVLEKALPAVEQADHNFFAMLTDKELTQFIQLFQKLSLIK